MALRAHRWTMLAAAIFFAPSIARASYVGDDLTLMTTRPTPENPRSGSFGDSLYTSIDTTESLSFTGRLSLTHDDAVPAQAGSTFGANGGNILLLSLGVDDDLTKHLNLGAGFELSPSSQQNTDSPITLTLANQSVQADSLLQTNASSLGGTLSLTYDTADPDADEPAALEWAFGTNLSATRFDSTQKVTRLSYTSPVTHKSVDAKLTTLQDMYCPAHPKAPICSVAQNLNGQKTEVTQFPLEADATATIDEDTDVGLAFTYYLYDKDPTQVGFFTVSSAGRAGHLGPGAEFGAGMPLAPEQYAIRPDVAHQFGPVYASLYAEYGQYLDDQGHEGALGLKVKWKINKHWKLLGGAVFSRDVPGPGLTANADPSADASQPVPSSMFTAGVRYTF